MRPGRALAALLAAALVANTGAVQAAEGGKSGARPHVDYTGLPLPVIVNGRLVNYVFLILRLTARREDDLTLLKEREPYVRDRLLRVGHLRPFTVPGDFTRVDDARVLGLVRSEADGLFGRGLLGNVEIASETPQRRSGLPSPPSSRAIIP